MIDEYKTINVKLNGKQSLSIPLEFRNHGRLITDGLNVVVRGFLKFSETYQNTEDGVPEEDVDTKTIVYPVLFTYNSVFTTSGKIILTILPRSEDLFESTESLKQRVSISDSDIYNNPNILEDEAVTEQSRDVTSIEIKSGDIRKPYYISIEITAYSEDGSYYARTIDRGTNPQVEDSSAVASIFQVAKKYTPSNFIIDCYNDEEWIPTIDSLLESNSGSKVDAVVELDRLSRSTPFGATTMYDALVSSAQLMSDNDVSSIRKIIYNFTDNETVGSVSTVEEAVDEINNIDGIKKVPVLNSNMSIVSPETLSVRAKSTDTSELNNLSFNTGGQSVTVTSEDYLDDVVGIFYSASVGSLGYGEYVFVLDLGSEASVNHISTVFDIPHEDANATWTISTSMDNFSFTEVKKQFGPDESVELKSVNARYIRFEVLLITGLTSSIDEYTGFPASPALTSVTVIYNQSKVRYLYLNSESDDNPPYHMTFGVNASDTNDNQISVGLSKSNSSIWEDYYNGAQPTINQNGKVVVPIRFSQIPSVFDQEPLMKIDHCILKTSYGAWDPQAMVYVYDGDGNVVQSNKYTVDPREGTVILDYALPSDYVDGSYTIGILNTGEYKVGMKLTNSTTDTPLEIFGVGYVYTTGKDLLGPLSKAAPEVRDILLSPEAPDKFTKMDLDYTFYDYNFEPEDISKRKIIWYVDGSPVSYLEDRISWNDINDPDDPLYTSTSLHYPDTDELGDDSLINWLKKQGTSIVYAGNSVYCEVQVSDGELYSERVKSNTLRVKESSPIVSTFVIKGKRPDNDEIVDDIVPGYHAVIHPEISDIFYGDGDYGDTEITWYCNDEVFKTGKYSDPPAEDNTVSDEIHVNEVGRVNFVDIALRINNTISVDVTPRTSNTVGDTISAGPTVVQNTKPYIEDGYDFVGAYFGSNANLLLGWAFYDFEIMALQGQDETGQRDETTVKWYCKDAGENTEFRHVYTYNDHDDNPVTTEKFIDSFYTGGISTTLGPDKSFSEISSEKIHAGQKWYAEITPHDHEEAGETVTTRTVTITVAS